jgi:hypothetical protein
MLSKTEDVHKQQPEEKKKLPKQPEMLGKILQTHFENHQYIHRKIRQTSQGQKRKGS